MSWTCANRLPFLYVALQLSEGSPNIHAPLPQGAGFVGVEVGGFPMFPDFAQEVAEFAKLYGCRFRLVQDRRSRSHHHAVGHITPAP